MTKLLETAARNNPAIGAAIQRMEQSKADLQAAAADMRPRVVGNLGARWKESGPASEDLLSASSYRNTYTATLTFLQTLYAGGSPTANRRAAEFALSGARAEAERACQQVMNAVRAGYYEVLRASALLDVRAEALELSREHLSQTEALFRGGLVPMGDVLRVQVSVSQGELERLRAASGLEVAWQTLERTAGAAKNSLPRAELLQASKYTPPQNANQSTVLNRPELRAYADYKKQADELVKAAAGARLPRVEFSAQTGKTDNSFPPDRNDDWYVGLNLEWSLFDGGRASAQVSRARASARELLYRIEDLTAEVELEVSTAEENLSSALSRLAVTEEQAGNAEEGYRRAMRRYEAQMSTNLDVLDARMSLTDSRLEYVNALYDIAAAQTNLVFAAGSDAVPEGLFEGHR